MQPRARPAPEVPSVLPRVTPALACRDRLAPDTLKGLLPLETTPVKNLKGKKKLKRSLMAQPTGPATCRLRVRLIFSAIP